MRGAEEEAVASLAGSLTRPATILVTCREGGWTCVTNDGALRRLWDRHGVKTRSGLALMVDLVAAGALTQQKAASIARRIQSSNPGHINERVLRRFLAALERL